MASTCKTDLVRCQICNSLKSYSKYKRHLLIHKKSGQIGDNSLGEILFATRVTRKTHLSKEGKIKFGKKCSLCSTRVLDLPSHLKRIHNLNSKDDNFILYSDL